MGIWSDKEKKKPVALIPEILDEEDYTEQEVMIDKLQGSY